MDININELFSNAVEERARELAAEMMAAQKKPQIEPIIAQNGEYVTPHFFFGEQYLHQTGGSSAGRKVPCSLEMAEGRQVVSQEDRRQVTLSS